MGAGRLYTVLYAKLLLHESNTRQFGSCDVYLSSDQHSQLINSEYGNESVNVVVCIVTREKEMFFDQLKQVLAIFKFPECDSGRSRRQPGSSLTAPR